MKPQRDGLPVLPPNHGCGNGREYPYLFRWLHWVLGVTVVVLVLTGLSQHAVARPSRSLFCGVLPGFFWPGRVHYWHFWAAVVFSPAVVAASVVCLRNNARLRPLHIVLLGGGVVTLITGLLMLTPMGPFAVSRTATWLHAVFGLAILPIGFLWHAAVGVTQYRGKLLPAFVPGTAPKWRQVGLFIVLALVTTWILLGGWPLRIPGRDLVAGRVNPPSADGTDLAALPWDEATPLMVDLANGAGFEAGQTRVSLRALHDGDQLFVLAEWSDPTENRRYMPWKKTADGWEHLITDEDDESVHYEDKFALIFPVEGDWRFEMAGCAVYCHAGGGRAYGYKGSNRPVDVWHWKSTRTDPVGQVDDKYWSEVDFEAKDVGRHGDPKQSGGYKKNVSQDKQHPAHLPDELAVIRQGILPAEHAVEYSAEAAQQISAGTIIPGIVASAAVGSRGDVVCESRHQGGRWKLYVRRKLKTDDGQNDVQFEVGRTYAFAAAAFDRSSKRHAYGWPVYHLVLEP